MLPQGTQSTEEVKTFIRQCKKSFITISGGGDPLYRFDEFFPALLSMSETIKAEGYKVRVITREVQHVGKLTGIVDHISISLDDDVLRELESHRHLWDRLDHASDIEFSIVLPPLPRTDLIALKPQYAALHKRLGRRLVLRENFNSIFPVEPDDLTFGHRGIVFVPKALCLSSRYLSTIDCTGHDLVQDNFELAAFLLSRTDVFLYGGLVKHLMEPAIHLEYDDIDMIALDADVMTELADKFSFSFREVSPAGAYPRYFMGRSARAGKAIQLVLMSSAADAKKFILNAQYNVDRVGFNQGFVFDKVVGADVIHDAIRTKTATLVPGSRDIRLFHTDRLAIERRHQAKLQKKGFMIVSQ